MDSFVLYSKMNPERLSVIDMGTNTMLMLIAEFEGSASRIKTLQDIQRIPRLGKGVDTNRNIHPESIEKSVLLLNEYKNISKEYKSEKIVTIATSFLRDAHNKNEFISNIKNETGLDIEILSGRDEAKWTFWGGIYDQLLITNEKLRICLIDIGGGSTEISFSDSLPNTLTKESILNQKIENHSLDIGSVRLKEKFVISQPPKAQTLSIAENYIQHEVDKLNLKLNTSELIGVAGTVTTLAAIKLNIPSFEKDKVEGLVISFNEIEDIFDLLIKKDMSELNKMGDYMKDRSDIIVTGILILKTFMNKFNFKTIKVSTKGLRYGIFLREIVK
jgi:exopolyphosphatase/guanosine-5'-triphosphate,3'-diphosphate pyrophosphatase